MENQPRVCDGELTPCWRKGWEELRRGGGWARERVLGAAAAAIEERDEGEEAKLFICTRFGG